ncbi:unnamed protein product [Arctogadus glacialis]
MKVNKGYLSFVYPPNRSVPFFRLPLVSLKATEGSKMKTGRLYESELQRGREQVISVRVRHLNETLAILSHRRLSPPPSPHRSNSDDAQPIR